METATAAFTILRKGPARLIQSRIYTGRREPAPPVEGLPLWLEVRCEKCGAEFRAPEVRRARPGTYQGLLNQNALVYCTTLGCEAATIPLD